MRVDLDEFDTPEPDKVWKVEVYQDQSGEYLPHPNFHPWDDGVLDWTAKAHNALPALIAELRAARECVRLYKRAGGLGWFFAAYPCTSCNTGVRHDRLDCELVQEAYQRGRDEERAKALSGADAYLKHAITEATNEAYQRGKADERAAVVAFTKDWMLGCTFEADEVEKGEHEVKR